MTRFTTEELELLDKLCREKIRELTRIHEDYGIDVSDRKNQYYRLIIRISHAKNELLQRFAAENSLIEVPTKAGVIRAYRNGEDELPGITVMLQPAGYADMIDITNVRVWQDSESEESAEEGSVMIRSYGDASDEDPTYCGVLRRVDILKACCLPFTDDTEEETK